MHSPCGNSASPDQHTLTSVSPPLRARHYARFTLSYCDVEDLLAERGLDISYETVRR